MENLIRILVWRDGSFLSMMELVEKDESHNRIEEARKLDPKFVWRDESLLSMMDLVEEDESPFFWAKSYRRSQLWTWRRRRRISMILWLDAMPDVISDNESEKDNDDKNVYGCGTPPLGWVLSYRGEMLNLKWYEIGAETSISFLVIFLISASCILVGLGVTTYKNVQFYY